MKFGSVKGIVFQLSDGSWAYYVRIKFFDGSLYEYQTKIGFPSEEVATTLVSQDVDLVIDHLKLILSKDEEFRDHQSQQTSLKH